MGGAERVLQEPASLSNDFHEELYQLGSFLIGDRENRIAPDYLYNTFMDRYIVRKE